LGIIRNRKAHGSIHEQALIAIIKSRRSHQADAEECFDLGIYADFFLDLTYSRNRDLFTGFANTGYWSPIAIVSPARQQRLGYFPDGSAGGSRAQDNHGAGRQEELLVANVLAQIEDVLRSRHVLQCSQLHGGIE